MPGTNPYNTQVETNDYSGGFGGGNDVSGKAAGIMAGASGFMDVVGDIRGVIQEQKDFSTAITAGDMSGNERPSYGLVDEIQKLDQFRTQEVGKGMIGSGFGKGAIAGVTAGASFGPWGALIGGAAGALGGGIGAIFGKKKAKRIHEEKLSEFEGKVDVAQGEFNEANDSYYDAQTQRALFNKRQERKNNPFNIPSINSMLS